VHRDRADHGLGLAPSTLVVPSGVGDGGGFLLGSAFRWPVSDSLSNILQTRMWRRWFSGLVIPVITAA
jgi:hypothetical protein